MGYAQTVKAATAAAAAVLVAAGVRFGGPAAAGFVAEELPRAQAAAATWLKPPYLYLVINAIIISIAASSRFQPNRQSTSYAAAAEESESAPAPVPVPAPALAVPVPVPGLQAPEAVAVEEQVVKTAEPTPAPEVDEEEEEFFDFEVGMDTAAESNGGRGGGVENEVAPFADLTNSREKPMVSARFGRKAAKPSAEESRALRVARLRREETLESTWKAITEGLAPPLARHLKKSDTWETRPGRLPSGGGEDVALPATMRKAETFNDGAGGGGRKVRREPSLGQDELNRRIEAFINKFKMEIQLQRQGSLKHYNDMVGHY